MNADVAKNENLVGEKEAALILGVSKITLLRMRKRAAIAHYRIGSRVFYSQDHLHDFLKSCERKSHRSKVDAVKRGGKRVFQEGVSNNSRNNSRC